MKSGILTKLADRATGFRKVLNQDEQIRIKRLMDEGWKIESHGTGGVVLVKRCANVPVIFGGKR